TAWTRCPRRRPLPRRAPRPRPPPRLARVEGTVASVDDVDTIIADVTRRTEVVLGRPLCEGWEAVEINRGSVPVRRRRRRRRRSPPPPPPTTTTIRTAIVRRLPLLVARTGRKEVEEGDARRLRRGTKGKRGIRRDEEETRTTTTRQTTT